MKQFLRLSLVLVLSIAWFPQIGVAAEAKIIVVETDINFGTVVQGEKVERVFSFSNAGDAALKIDRVKSSCGCTAALLSSRDLQPDEAGEVRATFDSTRFQGLVTKTIYLYTNDPLNKVVQLHLRGEVVREVTLVPNRLHFGQIQPGGQQTLELTLSNVSKKELVLEEVTATAKELSVSQPRVVVPPGEKIVIPVVASLPEGKNGYNAYVLLTLSGSVLNKQRVPVSVQTATPQ